VTAMEQIGAQGRRTALGRELPDVRSRSSTPSSRFPKQPFNTTGFPGDPNGKSGNNITAERRERGGFGNNSAARTYFAAR